MGRTNKIGLDYFPLNIDMDEEDERVFMMEAQFGGERAFGLLIKLLMWIYRSGYYYPWTETEQVFFAKKKGVDKDFCIHLVDFLLQKGFFCKHLFDRFRILTSRGIQKRYFEATKRRDKVVFIKDFLLLDPATEIISCKNLIFVDINTIDSYKNGINVDILHTLVHKGEESKGDEKRVNETKGEEKKGEETEERRETKAAPPSATPPEVHSPPLKTKPGNNNTKPKDQQLAELADLLRVENPAEYQKLLHKHPELIAEPVPWEKT